MAEAIVEPHKGSILEKIRKITSNRATETFLSELSITDSSQLPKGEDYVWRLVGGSISSAANIHTTPVSITPIIERITNSYDAAIEVKEFENNNGNPMENSLPENPRKAVEKWWHIPNGDTATYSKMIPNTERTKFAKSITEVSLRDSGNETQPTIVVQDTGIGQSPDDFSDTLLRLGHSIKMSRSHLHGTYGHGGSSTFRFCDYTIIISRRNPVDLHKDTNWIGWTIVRKNNLKSSNLRLYDWDEKKFCEIKQPPVYEFLCKNDGNIPRVPLTDFPEFVGTYISHIEYQAKEWQNLTRGLGYRLFRNYLFDPVLPFRLADDRENTLDFERNMFGARSTLDGSKDVAYRNESVENLGERGKLVFRYWMLYNEEKPSERPLTNYIERENSRNTIIVTLNGQRHGTLEKSLISKICRLPRVADTLLVQVLVDGLNKMMIGELNTSNRGQLVQESNTTELIQNKLIECLKQDPDLYRWEQRLSELHAIEDESINEVKRLLDQLLDIGIDSGIGGVESHQIPQGVGTNIEFNPCDPPTILDLATKEDPIEIRKGESRSFTFELNAPDDIFRRRIHRGHITQSDNSNEMTFVFATNQFKNGRLPVEVRAKQDAEEYVTHQINFIFDADNLPISLERERSFVIIPQPKYEPVDPPTEFKFLRGNPIELQIGKHNIFSLKFNGTNDILTRLNNPATLDLIYDYPSISLVRRIGPNNGKIQFTLQVKNSAKINDVFKIKAQLKLSEDAILSDERLCRIIPQKEPTQKKGDYTKTSRPNYDLKRIKKENWGILNWNEENIGKHELKKDEADKDCLNLYINVDSLTLENERQRRIRMGHSQNTIDRIDTKYVAHIAYHLFQQFDADRKLGAYDYTPSTENKQETIMDLNNPEQIEAELKRVAKTLVLSFRGITDREED